VNGDSGTRVDSEISAAWKWYGDGGHAWLSVPGEHLARVGALDSISTFSYVEPDTGRVYLEEDCDVYEFLQHLADFCGVGGSLREIGDHFLRSVPFVDCGSRAALRDFPSFTPGWVRALRGSAAWAGDSDG